MSPAFPGSGSITSGCIGIGALSAIKDSPGMEYSPVMLFTVSRVILKIRGIWHSTRFRYAGSEEESLKRKKCWNSYIFEDMMP